MIGYNAESSAEFLKAWHVPGGVVHLKRLPRRLEWSRLPKNQSRCTNPAVLAKQRR